MLRYFLESFVGMRQFERVKLGVVRDNEREREEGEKRKRSNSERERK